MHKLSRRQVLAAAGAAGVATVAGGALAGCDSEPSQEKGDLSGNRVGAMEKYGVGDQFKASEPLTFSLMLLSNANYPYKKEWLFWSELTKRTNVTIDPVARKMYGALPDSISAAVPAPTSTRVLSSTAGAICDAMNRCQINW